MKCGYVAVIGRANAGKSTLVNAIVGEKVSIVSPKPQTTRERVMGVLTEEDLQIAFVDTPGLYKAESLLNSVMQKTAMDSVQDVDLILYVLDAHEGIAEKDKELFEKFLKAGVPIVLALNKIDIMPESLLISEVSEFGAYGVDVVPVSARKKKNLKELIKTVKNLLPEGEKIFEQEIISDRSERFMISEIMREKILLKFEKEIPHGVAVIVNTFKYSADGKRCDINLDIVCEKQNHKAILIGKQGSAIKEVSTMARLELERFLDCKVFLTTYIKVDENWRNNAYALKKLGYDGV
jgi:GTP-binding protein Era